MNKVDDPLRLALAEVRRVLTSPNNGICDTIWRTDIETLVDYITSVLGDNWQEVAIDAT